MTEVNIAQKAIEARKKMMEKKAVAVAVAPAPKTDRELALEKAAEHVAKEPASGEALATFEMMAKPPDHADKIEDLSHKFNTGADHKGKPTPSEQAELNQQQEFLREANLYNDLLQYGYDNIPDVKDSSGAVIAGHDKASRQTTLRKKIIDSLSGDRNFKSYVDDCYEEVPDPTDPTRTITQEKPGALQELAERYLRTGTPEGDITLAKLESNLSAALEKEEFSAIKVGSSKLEIIQAQEAVEDAKIPLEENQDTIDEVEDQLHDFDDGDPANAKGRMKTLRTTVDAYTPAQKDEVNTIRGDIAALEQKRATLAAYPTEAKKIDKQLADLRDKEPYKSVKDLESLQNKEKELKKRKRQLVRDRSRLEIKLDEAKEAQQEAQKSRQRNGSERLHKQKVFNREIGGCLGKAALDHEYTEAKAVAQRITERVPVEEQELANLRTEAEQKTVNAVNKFLDERWRAPRRYQRKPGTGLVNWGRNKLADIKDRWIDPNRQRYREEQDYALRSDLIEDDWLRTMYEDTDKGIDTLFAQNTKTGQPEMSVTLPDGTVKKFSNLDPADQEKARMVAFRHMANARYELSVEVHKNHPDRPIKTITQADINRIMDNPTHTWVDSGITEGLRTEQATKALAEKDPNNPADEPITAEDLDKAKKGDKDAIAKIKRIARMVPRKFALILALPLVLLAAAAMTGVSAEK